MDSNARAPGSRGNLVTVVAQHVSAGLSRLESAKAVDLRAAYKFSRSVARLHPAEPERRRAGHRLVWVRESGYATTILNAADDAFAVVGRHTQCELVLADDPHVALRHLLVKSVGLAAGGVALRVFDLQTGLGFVLPDGSRHASIFAEGPVAIAVGSYALVALPNETPDDELPDEMPAPVVESPSESDPLHALASAMSPYRVNARPLNRLSRITLLPRLLMVGEDAPDSRGAGPHQALTLARGGRSATVAISDAELARGVIIGRSEKCHSETLRRITDENVSRTHLLVLREGRSVCAYDLASTQGTFVNGQATRRAVLSESGTALTLGRGDKAVQLAWHQQG